MTSIHHIPIVSCNEDDLNSCQRLADQWGLELLKNETSTAASDPQTENSFLNDRRWYFQYHEEVLCLHDRHMPGKPLHIDFLDAAHHYRRRHGGGKKQLIARAIGMKTCANPRVLDLTAGLGEDAFVLASLGCAMTMIERAMPLAALLEDALARLKKEEKVIGRCMQLYHGSAEHFLTYWQRQKKEKGLEPKRERGSNKPGNQHPNLSQQTNMNFENVDFDVIYIDPMFENDAYKKSLVKKNMQMLQALLKTEHHNCTIDSVTVSLSTDSHRCAKAENHRSETKNNRAETEKNSTKAESDNAKAENDNASTLLNAALNCGVKRVVIKRPIKANPVAAIKKPSLSYRGKSIRFDVYLQSN
jgi:16S rRNA G966 N2-methylase RsmD